MKKLWGYMELRFRLQPDKYNAFFKFCVGLTNYHISLMPLRREDGAVKRNYNRRLYDQKKQAEKKRKAQQENSRAMRRARLEANARSVDSDGELLGIGDSDEWSHSLEDEPEQE